MKVYIGSDHAGFHLKDSVQEHLKTKGHDVLDLGVFTDEVKTDYPDMAREVGEKVQENGGAMGVLICGSGTGMCMAANKIHGIRAVCARDVTTARYARLHNDANIVALGERFTGTEVAKEIVDTFFETKFEGGRHEARVAKITQMEGTL